MKYIIHDLSVALWALRHNCGWQNIRIAIHGPISIRPRIKGQWHIWEVRFQKPVVAILVPYEVELCHHMASPDVE